MKIGKAIIVTIAFLFLVAILASLIDDIIYLIFNTYPHNILRFVIIFILVITFLRFTPFGREIDHYWFGKLKMKSKK